MDRMTDFSETDFSETDLSGDSFASSNGKSVPEEPLAAARPAAGSPTSLRGRLLFRSGLLRFAGSWIGFSGLYAASGGGACPFCGQSTCPAGFLSAGIVGGVLAFGLQAWRRFQK